MRRVIRLLTLFLICTSMFLSSCKKKAKFPETPEIKFESYSLSEVADTILVGNKYPNVHFVLSFKDGQGDIGLNQEDTAAATYYNFFIRVFVQVNGVFEEKSLKSLRLPNDLSKYSDRNGLEGLIEVDYRETGFSKTHPTIKYELQLLDRAQHRSNVVTTPEITL